jgi:hypothetical protein
MSAATVAAASVLPFAVPSRPAPKPIDASNSLFEIDRELDLIFDQYQTEIEENGEACQKTIDIINGFIDAFGVKVDRIGGFLKTLEYRADVCRHEAERLTTRARVAENKISSLKKCVLYFLVSRNLVKIEGARYAIRRQKNSQDTVSINDLNLVPMQFKRIESRLDGATWERILEALPPDLRQEGEASVRERLPAKDAIALAAKTEEVPGATVRREQHLRVS